MAVLQLMNEEEIAEEGLQQYFEDLYKVICVSERPSTYDQEGSLVRTTYIVDWEQLVHLLEDYGGFGEDIVEVARIANEEAWMWRQTVGDSLMVARA